MPIYTETIKQIIYAEDVRKMWQNAKYEHERVLLSLMWLTGARPAELLELKRGNVNWGIGDDGMDFKSGRRIRCRPESQVSDLLDEPCVGCWDNGRTVNGVVLQLQRAGKGS